MIKDIPQRRRRWLTETDWRKTHTSIDHQQIDIIVLRLLAHILDERDIVSPIGAIVFLLQMPFEPPRSKSAGSGKGPGLQLKSSIPMGIGGVQEVQLSPGKWRARRRGGILRIRLHTADVPGENDIALWMLAALAGECSATA